MFIYYYWSDNGLDRVCRGGSGVVVGVVVVVVVVVDAVVVVVSCG